MGLRIPLFNMFKGIFPKPDINRAEGERKEDQSQVKQEEQPQRAKRSKKKKKHLELYGTNPNR